MEMSHESCSKALLNEYQEKPQLTACKTMNNSQRRNSSSEIETLNQDQQETELTKSQGLHASGADVSHSTSQLYEESSFEKSLKGIDLNRYHDLYLAALKGDWETAKMIIDKNPEALTAKISMLSMTVLHVAAYSCNYKFVEKLVKKMSPEQVAVQDGSGNTALHFAAFTGVVDVAKVLLDKSPDLTEVQGSLGFIPLLSAVVHGAAKGKEGEEMVGFLASKTNNPFPDEATAAHLLLELTHAGFHDITLCLLRRFPDKATANIEGRSILSVLAVRPMDFQSGTRLHFWETWIYNLAPCKPVSCAKGDTEDLLKISEDPEDPDSQARATRGRRVCKWFKQLLWKIITTLAPRTRRKFLDVKRRHEYASDLATFVCERAKKMPTKKIRSFFVSSRILNLAGSSGIVEIIKTCLHHFPDLIMIWQATSTVRDDAAKHRQELVIPTVLDDAAKHRQELVIPTVLDDAIEHRRELVFNLLYARSELCILYAPLDQNNPLDRQAFAASKKHCRMHLAAKLAPAPQLSSVSGTALQMQRELQWFKAVEKIAHPSDKEKKDDQGYTPRELFTKEHKELVEKAEKWMKDTSNSCMVVTTLVATVVFAAAFTVPGGNSSQGVPIFLEHKPFTVFIISDALALFSALTSVLMFLSILTSRYAEDDFLKKLPVKLLIGLVSLFFAIAFMMIAFVAALWIVLNDKFKWVSIPVTVLASIPVTVFLSLQLPLCFQIYKSTFIGIFHPENIW